MSKNLNYIITLSENSWVWSLCPCFTLKLEQQCSWQLDFWYISLVTTLQKWASKHKTSDSCGHSSTFDWREIVSNTGLFCAVGWTGVAMLLCRSSPAEVLFGCWWLWLSHLLLRVHFQLEGKRFTPELKYILGNICCTGSGWSYMASIYRSLLTDY